MVAGHDHISRTAEQKEGTKEEKTSGMSYLRQGALCSHIKHIFIITVMDLALWQVRSQREMSNIETFLFSKNAQLRLHS